MNKYLNWVRFFVNEYLIKCFPILVNVCVNENEIFILSISISQFFISSSLSKLPKTQYPLYLFNVS